MEKPLGNTKDRGAALEVFIIISFLFSIYSIYNITFHPFPVTDYLPSWYPQFLIFLYILNILSLIGLWLYKKWAIYLFITLRLIDWVILYFNLSPLPQTQTSVQYEFVLPYVSAIVISFVLIFDGIFFWLLYKKRELFE